MSNPVVLGIISLCLDKHDVLAIGALIIFGVVHAVNLQGKAGKITRDAKLHPEIVTSVIQQITALGAQAAWNAETELLEVNSEMQVSIVLCRHTTTFAGSSRWLIRLDTGLKPDITIAVRMDATNEGIRDYYVLPGIDMTWENLRVAEANGIYLDTYRFDTLDYFFGMTERVKLEEVA